MRGDIDNTQSVRLDGFPSAMARVIWGARSLPEQRMQVGTVEVDYGHVAVWRPYHPNDEKWDASRRSGVWRNIYRLRVPLDQPGSRPGKVTYGLTEVEHGGRTVTLPRSDLGLSYRLKEHLDAL